MTKINIIGSGIIGLSVAEFFSRHPLQNTTVSVISNNHPLAGSYAAAANLATKGQLWGRDLHFQMKLDAKKVYHHWIQSLLQEAQNKTAINSIYNCGDGIDYFTSNECREKHFNRVYQKEVESMENNPTFNPIQKLDDKKIVYKNEIWINGLFILSLLKEVLLRRKVNFINETITNNYISNFNSHEIYILCTGAWTRELLISLNLPIPKIILEKERMTLGSTFYGNDIIDNFCEDYVLQEKITSDLKHKTTISGSINQQFISSSSIRILRINENNSNLLAKANEQLLTLAQSIYDAAPHLISNITHLSNNISRKNGVRVGYGHKEIVIEKLPTQNFQIFICAGVHKSGFLFAPMVGKALQNLLCINKK